MNDANLTIPLPVAKSNYVIPASQALTAFSAIGQFSDTVTPLQEAMFAAAVANGGTLMKPDLVQQVTASDLSTVQGMSPSVLSHSISSSVSDSMKQMMLAVVQQPEGTAYAFRQDHRRGDRRQDRHGRDRHGHEPERRRLHLLCSVRQPEYRRRRHHSGRRLRRLGGRTHRRAGHPGIPASRGESVSDYLLAGRYRLTDRIAAGGMGEVWRGEDDLLSQVRRGQAAADRAVRRRRGVPGEVPRRGPARGRLSHPGIAQVYDYGESAEFGGAYLVMELVNGEPLSAILARDGPLSPDATLDIVSQAARALHAAHEAGIVHRDIKPGNLLVAAGRHREDHRLRHRPRGRGPGVAPDRDRHGDGHGAVHVARAGDRRAR